MSEYKKNHVKRELNPTLAALEPVHGYAVRVLGSVLFYFVDTFGHAEYVDMVTNRIPEKWLMYTLESAALRFQKLGLRLKNMPRTLALYKQGEESYTTCPELYKALVLDMKDLGILPTSKGL